MLKSYITYLLESTSSKIYFFLDRPLFWIGKLLVNRPQFIPNPFLDKRSMAKEFKEYFSELAQSPEQIMHTRWKEASIKGTSYLEFLHVITRFTKTKTIIEIGRFNGRTLAQLASAMAENGSGEIISIDPLEIIGISTDFTSKSIGSSVKSAEQNFKGKVDLNQKYAPPSLFTAFKELRDYMNIVVGYSTDQDVLSYVEKHCGSEESNCKLLFIDGDHTYDGVRRDFELYSPFISVNGYIVFDDGCDPKWGVQKFLSELANGEHMGDMRFIGIEAYYPPYFDGRMNTVILKRIE